jgi:rubrerythrin
VILEMTESYDKLMAAFAGESQANRKYLVFAKKAEEEGLPQVAKLFRAAAEAETVHAFNHLRIAGKIGMTVANLDDAINPEFIAIAQREKNKQAEWSFNVANQVEEVHAGLYKKAQETLRTKKPLSNVDYYVCKVCGNTVERQAPEKCPICGAPQAQFLRVG